jgi:hypothetical protein
MSEKLIIHMVSLLGTLAVLVAWFSGYISGTRGWWWVALGAIGVYTAIYFALYRKAANH